ncbi:MAG: adenylate kinase [Cyclobacteriaceae bacterium]|nr:adenylate kinase [Cyclobacteriaceae bacterium]MCH8516388.1 adenylate kinase [Cyclobacteriaceae bacterium]
MLNIVLFGPPGAGKGTQSDKLISKYDLQHISTGDLFRKHLGEGTDLGKLAQKFMDEGNLVPDEVVIGMVDEKIKAHPNVKGFIFDGFPRTVKQAEALDELMNKKNTPITIMLALEVPDEELKKRLVSRGATSGRADDQDINKIENRIQVYKSETIPVADYYKQQNKFVGVNGVGAINEIFEALSKEIDAKA